jgi:hypothetical protein
MFEQDSNAVHEFKLSVVVVELFDSSKESDVPQPEDLGSSLFGFCHLGVFAGAHGKEYANSC